MLTSQYSYEHYVRLCLTTPLKCDSILITDNMPRNLKAFVPHSPEWRKARRENLLERKRSQAVFTIKANGELRFIRDCEGAIRRCPGPLPRPREECLTQTITSMLTDREMKALCKSIPRGTTTSAFVRRLVCEFLESRRAKAMPTLSFTALLPPLGRGARASAPPA